MLGTGTGDEESSLLLDECTDEKALLEAKPGAPVRDARPPAAPPAAPPAMSAPKAGSPAVAPEAAVAVEAAEEEVEEEVVAEVVEKEAPVEEPADKPGDSGAPDAPPAAPPADGPAAPPATPAAAAAPPSAPEAPPSSGPTEVARAPSAPSAPAAPSGAGGPPPAAPPAPPAAPSRRAAAPGPASAPPGAKASPAPAATEGPGQAVTWFAETPASEQPAARAGLGDAVEAAHETHHAASADLPTLAADQAGPDAVLAVPKLAGVDATSEVAVDKTAAPIDAGTVPEASAPRPINATKSDDPALAMKALDSAAPKIPAAPAPPPVVLQGEADPGQLGTLSSDASTEVGVAKAEASASLAALTPELMATKPVHETIAVPAPEALPELAPVGEMERLEAWDLTATDRDAFDAYHGNLGEDALNGIADEMKTAGTDLQAERVRLVDTGLADADAANADAQAKQSAEVEGARSELEAETEATRAAQQQAMDDANATIDAQRASAMSEIDAQVSTDSAAVDATFRDAQQKADAEVAAGEAKADQAKKPAESQSFWDQAIDAWQSVVQAIADTIVSLWTAVIAKVQAVFDAALSVAQTILDGLVKAVAMLISAYYDLVRSVIRNVLGQVFPELAEALCAWADKVQAALIAVCEAIAGALMAALKVLADGIIAGMGIALAGYKAYIAFLQSMADSIQRGEWPDAATMLLDALLTAAGIDPAGFRATFGKIDEIIDDVVENPGAIAQNGAEAVGTGFVQFGDNFLEHFIEGSVEWLTGATKVELPDEFSIAGIFDVCCQVLGLTPEYMKAKAVEHVGEGGVAAVEEMYAGVMAFLDGGFVGLWEHVQDKLTGLVDDVVVAIGSWLVEKAILVVGRWIAGLAATFGASAILEALIAAWQFAMWIADQMQAMYAIVQSTVDSVYDFVKGNIKPAADKIEGTLASLIAPAIDLVAKLLNIGNIADKVQSVIEGVREMIDGAIDSVFETLKSALGIGGKEEEKPTEGEFDGQIGEEIAFSAGGEGHKLWVDASGQVIVASKATPVKLRLDDWEKRGDDPPSGVDGQGGPKAEDKARATAAIRIAREKLGLVEKEVEEVDKKPDDKAVADAKVELAEKSLTVVLETLFNIYADQATVDVLAAGVEKSLLGWLQAAGTAKNIDGALAVELDAANTVLDPAAPVTAAEPAIRGARPSLENPFNDASNVNSSLYDSVKTLTATATVDGKAEARMLVDYTAELAAAIKSSLAGSVRKPVIVGPVLQSPSPKADASTKGKLKAWLATPDLKKETETDYGARWVVYDKIAERFKVAKTPMPAAPKSGDADAYRTALRTTIIKEKLSADVAQFDALVVRSDVFDGESGLKGSFFEAWLVAKYGSIFKNSGRPTFLLMNADATTTEVVADGFVNGSLSADGGTLYDAKAYAPDSAPDTSGIARYKKVLGGTCLETPGMKARKFDRIRYVFPSEATAMKWWDELEGAFGAKVEVYVGSRDITAKLSGL